MTSKQVIPFLSVVIPTRDRPESVARLLDALRAQTLRPSAFEVIVVDDGSQPPLALELSKQPYRCTVLRRSADHGAHAARLAGLHASAGERVLFLDDDVLPEPRVLEAHADATLGHRVALGPILYPEREGGTPFFRYMARFYRQCCEHFERSVEPGDYYVCNSSAPRTLFLEVFEAAASAYCYPLAGDGFDESLLAQVFASLGVTPVFAADAMTWHLDTRSFDQALADGRRSGEATGRLLAERRFPHSSEQMARPILGNAIKSRLRKLTMQCFWAAPWPTLAVARVLTEVVKLGPNRYVPAWCCHVPLRLARWEGMRSVIPSFRDFLRLIEANR